MALDQLDPEKLPTGREERLRVANQLHQKAQQAATRGELLVASLHACDAMMLFPNEGPYGAHFDKITHSVQDPLSLLPVATGAIHVATAAGRARVLMWQGRPAEALDLLCAATRVVPDVPYLVWAQYWLQAPQVLPSLPWDALMSSVVKTAIQISVDVPTPPDDDDPRLPNVRAAATYLAQLRQQFADQSVVWIAEVIARRRLGDPAATLAVAEPAAQRFSNDGNVRSACANALADAGRLDEALSHARAAMATDPADPSPLRDLANAHVRAGSHAEAAKLFEEVVQIDPHSPVLEAELLHARYLANKQEPDKTRLCFLRDRRWWDRRTRQLANEIDPPQPFINVLPGPADATANAARDVLEEIAHVIRCCGAGAHVALSVEARYPEAPSVEVGFDAGLRALGANGSIEVRAATVPQPDPRVEKSQLAYRLWSWQGMVPSKVYPQAEPQVQQAIATIAAEVFRREGWDAAAREFASRLDANDIHKLMAVLTDPPPPPPDTFDGVYWTYRCQIATALVLSHMGPWPQEPARAALLALLYGPSDWTTGAAMVALAWRALDNPQARPEVEAMFGWMRGQIAQEGFTCWELTLAECWLALGGHDDAKADDLRGWIDQYFETVGDKNEVKSPERRYGGLTLAQYAEFCLERDKLVGTIAYGGPQAAASAFVQGNVPPQLAPLCERFGVPLTNESGGYYPWIAEWQEAMNATPALHHRFVEMQRTIELERHGVSAEEKAAVDQILDGNMDMHMRMAQAQQAQREVAQGDAGEPDPMVFPGQPVARLSDYVGIMKGMQGGDMMGALGRYGLDMNSYMAVAQAWGAKMAADPTLTEKFTRMMQG